MATTEIPSDREDLEVEDLGDEDLDITALLHAWGDGESAAFEELLPKIYRELRTMADRSLRKERSGHTLQATALVNEAYLRLIQQDRVQWQNRNQFLGIAAQLMRRILVDHARKRQAAKRDAGIRMTLEDGEVMDRGSGSSTREVNLITLDSALERLASMDPRQARIVELRYFAGLKVEETAELMDISPRTVKREWQMARAWLKREMSKATED